ncbi:MAG: hypothetical protein KIT84_43885 [Labilithrix sp.]|nr:hypothetical protein [Labilithrix sp.]MCW5818019.1 hypothetical protein [Labilithrix sp.]
MVGLAAFAAFLVHRPFLLGALGVHLAAIAAVIGYSARRTNWFARPRVRHVRASATELRVDDVAIPRAEIASGRYQPRPPVAKDAKKRAAGSTVQLFDRWQRLVFEAEVASQDEGNALLAALGLDASQQRAEFTAASPLMRTVGRRILVMLASLAAASAFAPLLGPRAGPLWMGFAAPLIVLAMLRAKIVVGRDGVLLRWMGWKRFFPMADIVRVQPEGLTSILLELRNGKQEILYLNSDKSKGGGVETEYRDAVLARIREAHASQRALGPVADVSALVARGERTPEEWRKALAALSSDEVGYRRASVRAEDLWRVVEDPRAAEDARAGAALLLRKGLDEEGKTRVRVAAEATASPKLRVALEAATSESEEAAFEALEELAVRKRRR